MKDILNTGDYYRFDQSYEPIPPSKPSGNAVNFRQKNEEVLGSLDGHPGHLGHVLGLDGQRFIEPIYQGPNGRPLESQRFSGQIYAEHRMKSSVLPSSETANELQNIEKSLLELVTKPPCRAQSNCLIPLAGASKPLRLEQRQEQFPLCGLGSRRVRHLRDIELLCNFWIQHYQSLKQVEQYSVALFGRLSSRHLAQHDRPRDLGAAAGEEGVDSRRLREPSTSVPNLDGAAGGADLLLHQRGVSNPWTEGRADLRGAPQEEQPEQPEGFKDRGSRSSSPLCDHQEVLHSSGGSFKSLGRIAEGASRIPNFRRRLGSPPDQCWSP